ncbi:hypothetical protein ANANG_G00196000 [Anguilla anguilla]|uniref:Uncharacterized protein n=1 Tax=Anguilla anguilla TaxID=7936 RepID=A0A9D3M5G7_ANGAN|nr:hypothetical protein ANANG_G00196000 [Anguilla anguilla]
MPVCEEQEEGPAQNWTGLQEQRPHTAPSQPAGEMSLTAVMNNDAEGLPELCEEDHSSQIVDPVVESHDPVVESPDPVVESHDPVEAGTGGMSERDTPSQEKRKPPVRTRRGKLQVKPCVTQRKLRSSVRDEQGLLPEEAVQPGPSHTQTGPSHTESGSSHTQPGPSHTQPGPAHTEPGSSHTQTGPSHTQPFPTHTSPQTHPPTEPHTDAQQEEPAAASELSAAVELLQGIVGHSDLLLEERGVAVVAEHMESSDGEEEPLFRCHNTQDRGGSGCGSVTHLVLSDAFIPACEEQEEGPAQHWTGLQEQRPHTAPSQTAGEMSLSAVMIHQPTATQPDTEQEEPAAGSELLGVEELPQGIVGQSDLPQEEVGLLAGAEDEESISGGVEPLLGCQSTQDSCESLSVETAEAGSGCGSVTHLVLSDAFIPVCEEQEEGPAQHWTDLQEQRPHTAFSQTAGETALTAVMVTAWNNDAEDLAELCEEDHSSQTVDPAVESHDTAVESHDPVEAGTDGTSERDTPSQEKRKPPVRTRRGKLQVKPCVTQRKLRSSVRDEQGLLPEEAVQPGPSHTPPGPSHTQPDPAHTSSQTLPPTLPLPDTQQEDSAAASELPAAVELPQGTVGHSDLPQQEEGVAAGAEDEESCDGEEGHSTIQSTSATLTRSGRAPRGFLSFLSGGSGAGPASRPVRHVSQKPSVNTSRTGRRRTTADAVTEASAHNSPSSSSPTKVSESTCFSGPSAEPTNSQVSVPAEGEFLCARPSATEEEPTKVSEFYFQDIFTEVLESD